MREEYEAQYERRCRMLGLDPDAEREKVYREYVCINGEFVPALNGKPIASVTPETEHSEQAA